jgi:hypothetical protein
MMDRMFGTVYIAPPLQSLIYDIESHKKDSGAAPARSGPHQPVDQTEDTFFNGLATFSDVTDTAARSFSGSCGFGWEPPSGSRVASP